MSSITRRALRVYAALSELRPGSSDVLDALLPFFEPILAVMHGKVFDPKLFALGVQKVYRWRFNEDIAAQFIPRLVKAKYLAQMVGGKRGAYVVKFSGSEAQIGELPISDVLAEIIDEFETFSPRVTDLLNYNRSRDELTDILVRFLVSLDAYNPSAFRDELKRLQPGAEAENVLGTLEEGGRPLGSDDKYMAARFVQHICSTRPDAVEKLARLASIGLLTEVVEDFIKPVEPAAKVNLTVVVDAPLALDYLGCSGVLRKNDVRGIFDALRGIGCSFVVFPVTCEEMQRNLRSMLSNQQDARHGYTHEAIVKREVLEEFVRAVANDPESALEHVGIKVKPLDLKQMPNLFKYFPYTWYEDFFSTILWVRDVAPREHDATCLALTMRLREGKHSNDVFKCGYVFVTRNPRFVQSSREYCLKSQIMKSSQEGPMIHQRELATTAWLRTGLGAKDAIPRGHLIATCDSVLRVRTELRDAVAEKLRALTPDKVEQFELLVRDQRSMRRLADQTLNNESVVTSENAEELLEAMRQATIEEEKQAFQGQLAAQKARAGEASRANQLKIRQTAAERDEALAKLAAARIQDGNNIQRIAADTTRTARRVERSLTTVILVLAAAGVFNYFTGALSEYRLWTLVIGGVLAAFSFYHQLMNALERPKIGVPSLMAVLSKRLFVGRLRRAGLESKIDFAEVSYARGVVVVVVGKP
jgi:hypothetical protein